MLRLIGMLNFVMTLSAIGAVLVLTGGVPATAWAQFAAGIDGGKLTSGGWIGQIASFVEMTFNQLEVYVLAPSRNYVAQWDITLSNTLTNMREALYAGDFVTVGRPILIVIFAYLSLRFLARALIASQRRSRRLRVTHYV